jgi:adenylyl-sulfate kinase
MVLELIGSSERLGREVLLVTAKPRDPDASTNRLIHLAIDSQHGIPLYIRVDEDGERASVSDVSAIHFGRFSPSVFRFAVDATSPAATPAPATSTEADVLASASPNRRTAGTRSILASRVTIWLTGIPGAGKTTIAHSTERLLHQLGAKCCVLDGDELRRGLSSDLGLSREDRWEQARRVSYVAALIADSGVIPIVALVSPYAEDRARAREIHESAGVGFLEIWVDTPMDVCMERDPKGLYSACIRGGTPSSNLEGDGSGLTGIEAPYEAPTTPDLAVTGVGQSPRVLAYQIVEKLLSSTVYSTVLDVR